jgi:hypothetical protein
VVRRSNALAADAGGAVTKFLRIAVTAVSLTACLLLIALWPRSYWRKDAVWGWFDFPGYLQIDSSRGCLRLIVNLEHKKWRWEYTSSAPKERKHSWDFNIQRPPGLGWWLDMTIPHWFAAVVCASAATAPWIKWSKRFRVRTLLIAMTLVALLLGVIAATS